MTIIEKPTEFALFGINPRWLVVERTDAEAKEVVVIMNRWEGNAWLPIATLVNFYGDLDTVEFNLSKLLLLEYDLPSNGTIKTQGNGECNWMIEKYQVLLEEHGDTGVFEEFEGYAISGGRNVLENRRYDFYSDFYTKKKFLTLQPRQKRVSKSQPEWLYYPIMQAEDGDFLIHRVGATIQFSDGSTAYTLIPAAQGNVGAYSFAAQKGKVVFFTTGFYQLSLSDFETADKFVLSWKIRVSSYAIDGNSPNPQIGDLRFTSEEFEYILDDDDASWGFRYFIFENPYGGMDTLCTRGKAEIKSSQDRSSRMVTETRNLEYSRHPRRANRPTATQEVQVNIGWLNRSDRVWVEDLMLSKNVWEIEIDGNRGGDFTPILITSKNVDIHQDDESLQSSSFTYEYAEKQAR